MLNARWLVDLWMAGFALAFVLQTLFQKKLSRRTHWGEAPGWQREIAFWNVGICALIVSLRMSVPSPDAAILPALALLSLLLGLNHLQAALRAPGGSGHWAGVAGNLLGVVLYAAYRMLRH